MEPHKHLKPIINRVKEHLNEECIEYPDESGKGAIITLPTGRKLTVHIVWNDETRKPNPPEYVMHIRDYEKGYGKFMPQFQTGWVDKGMSDLSLFLNILHLIIQASKEREENGQE